MDVDVHCPFQPSVSVTQGAPIVLQRRQPVVTINHMAKPTYPLLVLGGDEVEFAPAHARGNCTSRVNQSAIIFVSLSGGDPFC